MPPSLPTTHQHLLLLTTPPTPPPQLTMPQSLLTKPQRQATVPLRQPLPTVPQLPPTMPLPPSHRTVLPHQNHLTVLQTSTGLHREAMVRGTLRASSLGSHRCSPRLWGLRTSGRCSTLSGARGSTGGPAYLHRVDH